MKYFILGLLSLPLITACTTIQEEYYGPYGSPPLPRAEVYRNAYPGHHHRAQTYPYQRGQAYPRGPRYVERHANTGSAVIVTQRNQAGSSANVHGHIQRGFTPNNSHGHSQSSGQVPHNTQGHTPGVVRAPQNTHGHGQGAVNTPQNTHGHSSTSGSSNTVTRPAASNEQTQGNVHGHN